MKPMRMLVGALVLSVASSPAGAQSPTIAPKISHVLDEPLVDGINVRATLRQNGLTVGVHACSPTQEFSEAVVQAWVLKADGTAMPMNGARTVLSSVVRDGKKLQSGRLFMFERGALQNVAAVVVTLNGVPYVRSVSAKLIDSTGIPWCSKGDALPLPKLP
jgi:hypothetical protein